MADRFSVAVFLLKKLSMKKILSIIILLMTGLFAGLAIESYLPLGDETALEHAIKHQAPDYICPMHAEIVSSQQGSCPICGMDLVLIKKDFSTDDAELNEKDVDHPVVRVPSVVINNLGVRVSQVERNTLVSKIETPGYVQLMRKEKFSRIRAPARGRVLKFRFQAGELLHAGDALVDIELDDLVKVQEKHLALLRNEETAAQVIDSVLISSEDNGVTDDESGEKAIVDSRENSTVIETLDAEITEGITDTGKSDMNNPEQDAKTLSSEDTRNLMKRAGMTSEQIAILEKSKITSPVVTLYATHTGTPLDRKVEEGESVKANALLFTLGGMVRVTVMANAFQRDAASIQPGQNVDLFIPGEGNTPIKGRVLQGAVSINNTSQNIGVKLVFSTLASKVKSGMYLTGNVYARTREDVLSVPREALIYTENETRVIEALGQGRFKPVVVKTGITTHDRVEIVEGLEEGDTIVVSAQFLIDSESSLQASYRRMTAIE